MKLQEIEDPLLVTEIDINDSDDEIYEQEKNNLPKEKRKTVLALLIMGVGLILNTIVLAIIHDRVPNLDLDSRNTSKPLPDIILDHIPFNDTWALNTSEIIIMVSIKVCFIIIYCHKHSSIILRRIFLIMSWLYFVRSFTLLATVLPVASFTYPCSPREASPTIWLYLARSWQLITGFGLAINGKHTYCGDYMFSGHTVLLVMTNLIIAEYTPRSSRLWKCLHWLSWCSSVFGVVCIFYARGHYTIDIIAAYYITTRSFHIYHHMVDIKRLETNKHTKKMFRNRLKSFIWYPVFRLFEQNVNAPVPLEYECFLCPKQKPNIRTM